MNTRLDLTNIKKPKTYSKDNVDYLNIECGFDIETSSTLDENGKPFSNMYAWTFGIQDKNHIVYGRTWEEFEALMYELKDYFNLGKGRRLIVYVHNLTYDFQFMRKNFKWSRIFARDVRKPIIATTELGIEFKDSYLLSGYSLNDVAERLTKPEHQIKKLKGDMNHDLVRHYDTKLTNNELKYMENDVLIILYYINEQIELYDNQITKIPLSNTGRVRRFIKYNCYFFTPKGTKDSNGQIARFDQDIHGLTLSSNVYRLSKQAFMGGFTHANSKYVNKVVKDVVSYDLSSSYPSTLPTELFPMSTGERIHPENLEELKAQKSNYCLLFQIRFKNISRKSHIPDDYISSSKCQTLEAPILSNGRVNGADELVTTITDVDLDIIERVYTWDSVEIAGVYRFKKGYIPKRIIDSIITLFRNKTKLKGIKDKILDYQLSKEMLNAVYGMMVTDPVKSDIVYNKKFDEWGEVDPDMKKELKEYNEEKYRTLFYPWGIWVTAYARRNLWYLIESLGQDYIYSDTDSVKFKNHEKHKHLFERYNKMVEKKLEVRAGKNHGYTLEDFKPQTPEGETKTLGFWELDGEYSKFKTLGAKMYLVEHKNNKELEVTVSGLSKEHGKNYLKKHFENTENIFNNFTNKLTISAEESGKKSVYYLDKSRNAKITDYQGQTRAVHSRTGVYMENAHFTLDETERDFDLVKDLFNGYIYEGESRI